MKLFVFANIELSKFINELHILSFKQSDLFKIFVFIFRMKGESPIKLITKLML